MKEEYLHYIWKFGLFDQGALLTNEDEAIEIISKGIHNHNAGPDFLNAKIKIGNTIWAGNVEMHIKASDWDKHLHQNDPAYDNVILHVVLLDDREIKNSRGNLFPTLSLSSRIKADHYDLYKNLVRNKNSIPCEYSIDKVDPFIVSAMKERMIVERLERKTKLHLEKLERSGNDWQQLLYEMLASNFGFKVNKEPFEELAKRTPLKILLKYLNEPMQVEALVFGQAGFLDQKFIDEYPNKLKREYDFLKIKHGLQSMNNTSWKFMRMRPANFPTIRLAQFAAFIIKNKGMAELEMKTLNIDDWRGLFSFDINEYWNDHYQFDKKTKFSKKNFGESSFQNIIINTISHIVFVQGVHLKNVLLREGALELLRQLPTEKNNVISKWNAIGIRSKNAFDSQSLLELKNEMCDQKRCLNCNIGVHLMKSLKLNESH